MAEETTRTSNQARQAQSSGRIIWVLTIGLVLAAVYFIGTMIWSEETLQPGNATPNAESSAPQSGTTTTTPPTPTTPNQ